MPLRRDVVDVGLAGSAQVQNAEADALNILEKLPESVGGACGASGRTVRGGMRRMGRAVQPARAVRS